MSDLDKIREELSKISEDQGFEGEAEAEDPVVAEVLRGFGGDYLSQATVDFMLAGEKDERVEESMRGHADELVARALQAMRDARTESVADLLRQSREASQLGPAAAAAELGINVQALGRIERGTTALIRNLDPLRFGSYVRKLRLNAMLLVSGLFPLTPSGAVYGYAPRTSDDQTEAAQGQALARNDAEDRQWIESFLHAAGVEP